MLVVGVEPGEGTQHNVVAELRGGGGAVYEGSLLLLSTGADDSKCWPMPPSSSFATEGRWGVCGRNVLGAESRWTRGAALEEHVCDLGVVVLLVLARENGVTPFRCVISCSPSCQCMASTALHGIDISSATGAHIWCLNLARAC